MARPKMTLEDLGSTINPLEQEVFDFRERIKYAEKGLKDITKLTKDFTPSSDIKATLMTAEDITMLAHLDVHVSAVLRELFNNSNEYKFAERDYYKLRVFQDRIEFPFNIFLEEEDRLNDLEVKLKG